MRKLQYFVYPAVAAFALASATLAHAAGEGADFDFISSGQTHALPAAVTGKAASATTVVAEAARPAGVKLLKPVIIRGERLPAVDTASNDYNPAAQARSLRTRAEVMAEVRAGNRNTPFLPNVGGEPVGPFFYASLVEAEKAQPVVVVAERSASSKQ
ncbi:hypothetical protein [Rubrivivax rivuli]|uniref:DUF4148 domain-containing protein n=1 Tax=Rubrivivax rivuli TaxID=1862385 RepID=A0A437R9F7_9BURK|nr:hypothetical protein [Rubrivivax rivuli]RVU43420.1 hypothetical protein EOE66_21015 [Rubrivivax rivuli]